MAAQENPQERPQEHQEQKPQQQQAPGKIDLLSLKSAEIEHARPGPQSPQLEKDGARAMSHTASWQPSLGGGHHRRRSSYRQEDLRRELTMGSGGAAAAAGMSAAQGMGFTEGRGA